MLKAPYGIKVKLIGDLLATSYLFCCVLVSNFLVQNNSTNLMPLLLFTWLVVCLGYQFYTKKHKDVVDETATTILAKINDITFQVFLYCIGLVAILYTNPYTQEMWMSKINIGMLLFAVMTVVATIRLILYFYYDKKGIYN